MHAKNNMTFAERRAWINALLTRWENEVEFRTRLQKAQKKIGREAIYMAAGRGDSSREIAKFWLAPDRATAKSILERLDARTLRRLNDSDDRSRRKIETMVTL